MKTLVLVVGITAIIARSFAQGTLNFANGAPGVNSPVTNWDGTELAGPWFAADLWWAPGSVADSTLLFELGAPAIFRTNGYFFGGSRTIPGTTGGMLITVQVRVEGGLAGCPPFASDCDPILRQSGWSDLIPVVLASPPDPPVSLRGLAPFGLSPPTSRSAPHCTVNSIIGDRLVLSWPPSSAAASFVLQQNADLTTTNWITRTETPILVGPEFQIAIPKPTGTMFYRLVSK